MIEWMQKHKKWLVVTIWIAAIAFIGAGGFAWGMYDYSLSGNSVAKVGKITISKTEFSQAYQREFEARNARLGGNLDEAQAKAMGLDSQVLNQLISNALIRNYALDLGLRVSDEELARTISSNKDFAFLQSDGALDMQKYDSYIASLGMSKQIFEEWVRDKILEQKIIALLFPQVVSAGLLPTTALERESIGFSFGLQDKIEISIIHGASLPIKLDEKALKAFWEKRKEQYKTPASYKVQAIITKTKLQPYDDTELQRFYEQNYITQEDKTIPESIKPQVILALQQRNAKIAALKEYSELQKSKSTNTKELLISQDSSDFSSEILAALESNNAGATLKPLAYNEDFITLKIIEKNAPQTQSFEAVRKEIQEDFLREERLKELNTLANARLSTFKGQAFNVRMPTQEQIARQQYKIGDLDFYTSMGLVQHIFDTNKSPNYAIIGENAVLFRIMSQSITSLDSHDINIDAVASEVKVGLISQLVFEFLEKRYKIQRFI